MYCQGSFKLTLLSAPTASWMDRFAALIGWWLCLPNPIADIDHHHGRQYAVLVNA
jgi:hypothetical protein